MTAHQIDPLSVSLICHVQLHPRRKAFNIMDEPTLLLFPLFRRSIGSRSCDTNDSSLPQLILISVAWSNQESKSTAHIFNCYYYFLHGILISTTSRLTPEIRKVSVKVRQLLPRKIQWQPIALLYIYIYIYYVHIAQLTHLFNRERWLDFFASEDHWFLRQSIR